MTTPADSAPDPGIAARFKGLSHMIGNTPLLAPNSAIAVRHASCTQSTSRPT